MRVAIVTEAALNRRHGTGAQLLRYLEGTELEYAHLFFLGWAGWRSDSPRSLCLAQPEWLEHQHPRVRSFARRLGLYWWRYGGLRRSTRDAIRSYATPCDVAWVVVGGERGAQVARRVVAELGAPVLLHVMDLYADSLDACPHFRALTSDATEVIALTPTLAAEFQRVTGRACVEIGVGQRLDVPLARPRAIRYPGSHHADIPPELRGQVEDLGFIDDNRFPCVVAEHHVAYLQAPTRLDHFGRYSYPSRATDYLMAGLPVVGHSPAGSAAEAVLGPAGLGVRLVSGGASALAAAFAAVTATRGAWLAAHHAARDFAERNIDIAPQRASIRAALERCAFSRGK